MPRHTGDVVRGRDAIPPFRVISSASAARRLDAALEFLRALPPDRPATIVAANRGAADDLARRVARIRGATIGLTRLSFTQAAARAAAARLAARGVAPATAVGVEALAARTAFDAVDGRALRYFGAVAATPGFPRALARTLDELRLAGARPDDVRPLGPAGTDLAALLTHGQRVLDESGAVDRAGLLEAACAGVADEAVLQQPLVLLDLSLETAQEAALAAQLLSHAPQRLATVVAQDEETCAALETLGGVVERLESPPRTDLDHVRAFLFSDARPPERPTDGTLEFFSAPGEGRECVEMARRVLREARRGVRFDEMAILLRAPQHYHGLLEHALARAGIPAWFDRGTRRPHPAGRAFLALLACAAEGLSARRFAEYLSLGQIPAGTGKGSWVPSSDEVFVGHSGREEPAAAVPEQEEDGAEGAAAGTLPTPRRWEALLVEAAVIGGGPLRWERRLAGLAAEFERRLTEAERAEPGSARADGIRRDLARLERLATFALPLVTELAGWPARAVWGDWLDHLVSLTPRVLRTPSHVLRVLADLRPMARVGPVTLEEVRSVLRSRLLTVEADPPARRYGHVFVAAPAQARGRCFKVVFVPGLAERVFPQKPRQDPLLLDAARRVLGGGLATTVERGRRERLLLHLCAGAATERLYVSYPRLEVSEARARVPSFYALDLIRGASGRLPDHETLAEAAVRAGDPTLAWPAPPDPALAIDDQEHDLAVLRTLLDAPAEEGVRGRAQYLLALNPVLRRAVSERWARAERRWSSHDGLVRTTEHTQPALASQRFAARPYSLSALQRFARCPYQFVLSAIYRLEPAEQPRPLQRMDPLTRGSLVHRIQAVFLAELREDGALPVTAATRAAATAALDAAIERVAGEYADALLPAIERVWRDEVAVIARDLRGWLGQLARDGEAWTPRHFELAFGLPLDATRDPGSVADPVVVAGRFRLRGSIDLVERHRTTGALRVTDHKTGRNRTSSDLVIGGGEVLQPVLYSLVAETLLGAPATDARLSFCTAAGGFSEHVIPLNETSRRLGLEALEVVDRALELGVLPPAPAPGACRWCDFRSVCGPDEEARVARKPDDRLGDLAALRSRP